MCDRTEKEKISDDYLKTLEQVKEQYQQYVEISGLYTLPIQQEEEPIQYQPPSLENPLTTNTIRIMQNEVNVLYVRSINNNNILEYLYQYEPKRTKSTFSYLASGLKL